jgi:hypothetical protein
MQKKLSIRYVKLYTVEINRMAEENGRWYYQHKGELFNCVLIPKHDFDYLMNTVHFLVVDKDKESFTCPTIIKTIRPIDCKVIQEQIIINKRIAELIDAFGDKNGHDRIRALQESES